MSDAYRLHRSDKSHFGDVANLHCKEITGGVLSILGEEFLAVLYRYISDAPECGVWISHDRGNLNGFISGCADDKKMFRWVLLHGFFPLVAVGLKSITRPGVILGAMSVVKVLLNSNRNEPTPRSQLLSLAVNSDSRNKGIGGSLVRALETELGVWDINDCLVWTTQSNLRAIAFYESNGFRKSHVVQHATENMVGLIKVQNKYQI